jgi:acetylornithine aminotransferase
MVTLAKGLGGGLPIGALLTFGPTAELLAPGHHGSTFGGSPAACAAALAVLREIESGDLLRHVQDLSARITTELEAVPGVERVRGEGLLLGVILQEPKAKQVELDCRQAGLLVNAIGDEVIRLAPPLNLTVEQADRATSILAEAIA